MALDNLFTVEFTPDELLQMDNGLNMVEQVLKDKTHNLTPDERRQYGRIAEQNKLFVNKSRDYMHQYPDLVPGYIDRKEFERDYEARAQIEQRLIRLEGLTELLSDTKTLLDHDNYNNALSFYRSVRLLSNENVPGSTHVFKGLRQFFSGGRHTPDEPEQPGGEVPATN